MPRNSLGVACLDRADAGSVQCRLTISRNDPTAPNRTCQVPASYHVLQMSQTLYGFCFEARYKRPARSPHSVKQRPYIVLKAGDILRWRRASEAVERFLKHEEGDESYIDFRGDSADRELNPDYVDDFIVHRIHNWPTDILSSAGLETQDIPTCFSFGLAGLFYGGIHLVAINAPFHGRAEFALWFLSSISLMSTGTGIFIGLSARYLYGLLDSLVLWFLKARNPDPVLRGQGIELRRGAAYFTFAILVPLYLTLGVLLARAFLIIECFISLFRLDPMVFAVPSWVVYFPHIN